MTEVLLLHVSDTHLGSSKPLTYSRARELDFYDVFDEVIDLAVQERVDAVIHCGDLFDDFKPSPRTYYYAVKSLKRLSVAGIPFLVVAGQHDQPKRAEVSPLKVLEEVGVARVLALSEPRTHVVSLRTGELGVTAVPYSPPEVFSEWVGRLRKAEAVRRVLMAHLLLKELGLPTSHASLVDLDAAGYNYVALGDYHTRYSLRHGNTPVVYPGSTEALAVSEASSERYVALVDLSKSDVVVNWIKLSRFRRIVVMEGVRGFSDLEGRLSKLALGESGKPPILYVEFSRHVDQWERVRSRLDELVRRGLVLGYKPVGPEVAESEERSSEDLGEAPLTLESVVYEVAKDPEIAELLLGVIRSSEDDEAVEKLIKDVLGREKLVEKIEKLVRKK
ncbi:MAG: DNA repair exonuclease [Sulfolobales archaeon]